MDWNQQLMKSKSRPEHLKIPLQSSRSWLSSLSFYIMRWDAMLEANTFVNWFSQPQGATLLVPSEKILKIRRRSSCAIQCLPDALLFCFLFCRKYIFLCPFKAKMYEVIEDVSGILCLAIFLMLIYCLPSFLDALKRHHLILFTNNLNNLLHHCIFFTCTRFYIASCFFTFRKFLFALQNYPLNTSAPQSPFRQVYKLK